jgi:hypothetical protein
MKKDLFKIEELEPRLELSEWAGSCNGNGNEVNNSCQNSNCEHNNSCTGEPKKVE